MPTLRLCIAGCPPMTGITHDFPHESEKERRDLWFRMFGHDPEHIPKGKKYYACYRHFSSRMCKGRTIHKLGFPDQFLSKYGDLNSSTTVVSSSYSSQQPQTFKSVVLRLQTEEEKPPPLKYATIQYNMEVQQNADDDNEDQVVIDAGPAGANKLPTQNCILQCKDGHIFYRLPSIERDGERRKKWLYLLGKDPNIYTRKDIYVCDQHFAKVRAEVGQLYPSRNLPPPLQDSIPNELEGQTECIQKCTDYRRKYKIPSVRSDAKRRNMWLNVLGLEPSYYKHDIYICDRHFSDQMRIDRFLIPDAMPDQNIFHNRRTPLKTITKDVAVTATSADSTAAAKSTTQQTQDNNQTKNITNVKQVDAGTKSFTLKPIFQILPQPQPPVTYVKMNMLGVFVPTTTGYMETVDKVRAAEDPLDFAKPLDWIAPIVPELNIEVHQIHKEDYEYETEDEGEESEAELRENGEENTDYYDSNNESDHYTDYKRTRPELASPTPQQAEVVESEEVVDDWMNGSDFDENGVVNDIEENLNTVTRITTNELPASVNNATVKKEHDFNAYFIKMLKEAEVKAQNTGGKRKASAVNENSEIAAKRRIDEERAQSIATTNISKDTQGIVRSQSHYFVPIKDANSSKPAIKLQSGAVQASDSAFKQSASIYLSDKCIIPDDKVSTPEGITSAQKLIKPAIRAVPTSLLINNIKPTTINTNNSKPANKVEIQEVITINAAVDRGRDFVLEQLAATYPADELDIPTITKVTKTTDNAVTSARKEETQAKKLTKQTEEIFKVSEKGSTTTLKLSIPVDPLATPVDPVTTVDPHITLVNPHITPVNPLNTTVHELDTSDDELSTTVDPVTASADPLGSPVGPPPTPLDPLASPVDRPPTPLDPLGALVDELNIPVDEPNTPDDPLAPPDKVLTRAGKLAAAIKPTTLTDNLAAANKPITLTDKISIPDAKLAAPTGKNSASSVKVMKLVPKLTTTASPPIRLDKVAVRVVKPPTIAKKLTTPIVKSNTLTDKLNTPVAKLIKPTEKNSIGKSITPEHKLTTPVIGALSNSKNIVSPLSKPIVLDEVTKMNAPMHQTPFNPAKPVEMAGRDDWLQIVNKVQNTPKICTTPAIKPIQNSETDDVTEAVLNGTSWQEVRKIIEKKQQKAEGEKDDITEAVLHGTSWQEVRKIIEKKQKSTEAEKKIRKMSNEAEKTAPQVRMEVKYKLKKVVRVGGEGDKTVATAAITTASAANSNSTATTAAAPKRTKITKREVIDMRKDRGMPAVLIKTGGKYLLVNRNLAAEKSNSGNINLKKQQPVESSPNGNRQNQHKVESLHKGEVGDQNESVSTIESTDSLEKGKNNDKTEPQPHSLINANEIETQKSSLTTNKSTSDSEKEKRQDQSGSALNNENEQQHKSLHGKLSTDEQFYGFSSDNWANKEDKDELQAESMHSDEFAESKIDVHCLLSSKKATDQSSNNPLSCVKECSNYSKLFAFPSGVNGRLRRQLWFFELGLNFPMYWHKTLYICDKHFDRKMFVDEDTLNAMAYPRQSLSVSIQADEQSYEGLLSEWCDMRDLERKHDKEITRLKNLIRLKQEAARLMAELAAAGAEQEDDVA